MVKQVVLALDYILHGVNSMRDGTHVRAYVELSILYSVRLNLDVGTEAAADGLPRCLAG